MAPPRRTRFPLDLVVGAGWTLAAAFLAFLDAPMPLKAAVGLPLVLVLPGYAVLSVTHPAAPAADGAVEPKGGRLRALSWRERLLLSVPLSVSMVAAVLLVANFTELRIEGVPVVSALAVATLLGLALGLAARFGGGVPVERRPEFVAPAQRRRPWHEWASLALLLPAVGAAVWAATVFSEPVRDDGYVSLFVEPNQRTDCYPLQHVNGTYGFNRTSGRCTASYKPLSIVVNNHQEDAISYRLVVLWSLAPGPDGTHPDDRVVDERSGELGPIEEVRGLDRQLVVPLALGPPPGPGLHYAKVHLFVDGEERPSHALQLRVEAR